MKKFSLLGFILLVCFGMAIASVQAQTETIIAVGDTVNGTITADSNGEARYSFAGSANSSVVITMTSNDFDSYLVLIDFNGNVIAEDDDSGGRLNAQITATLPSEGAYSIIATSLRAYRSQGQFAATGDFTLSLTGDGGVDQPLPTPTGPAIMATPTLAFNTPDPISGTATPTPFAPSNPELAGTISYGGNISSTIPQSFAQQRYSFSATAGDVVVITMTSTDFDGYLFLYDAGGVVLTQDDDGAGDRNPRITYTIPATGEYIIGADSFGNVVGINPGFGVFTISLELDGTSTVVPVETITVTLEVPDDGVLDLGETVTGNFSSDAQEVVYTFTGSVGQIVTLSLASEDTDTYLILRDSEGTIIAENDDSAGSLNSQIGPFQLTEDTAYEIVATSYSYFYGSEMVTGRFTLSATEAVPTAIEYATPAEGQLNAEGDTTATFAFEGEAGDVVTLDLSTLSYSLYAQLIGPNGTINQTTAGGNALLGPIILSDSGLYVVIISSYDLYEPSDYSFVVNTIEPLPIAYDEPATNTFSADESVYVYTFEGAIGDGLDVTVNSEGAVDTRVTLTSPSGTVIASDDDSGAGFDPELLGIILTEEGTYSLLVQPYVKGDSGDFVVSVSANNSMALDESALTIRLSDKTFRGVGIFEGTAGETVMLSIRVIAGAENQPYVTVTQGEEVLAVQSIGTVKRLIVELEIPADGPVQVSVEDVNYGNSVIEFSIER
jgi:hypothetical protein